MNLRALVSIFIGAVIILMVVALYSRARLERKPKLPEDARQQLQAALLEAVKHASADQGAVVTLNGFWRGSGIKPYQRRAVIQPLIDDHIVADAEQSIEEPLQTIRDVWWTAINHAPTKLRLTDRTWVRMVHDGVSGRGIVIERIGTLNWQYAGRDIKQSPQTAAGRDARVDIGRITDTSTTSGISTQELTALVGALREDALVLTGEGRAKVRSLANKLETELDQEEQDTDAIEDSVTRAQRYVGRFGAIMASTSKLLESWHKLRGDL